MPAPQDTAESAEPPASATRGAEIAPLVETEQPSPAELLRKAHEEIEDAEARLRRWEEGAGATAAARAPFDLTIQPMVSGKDAAIELSGVTAAMPVSELLDLIHAEKPEATPDRQRLFIAKGAQEPLADETLPIGAYGVMEGVPLHMAMRDEKVAAARRELRTKLRTKLRSQRVWEQREREREQREQREREWEQMEQMEQREQRRQREQREQRVADAQAAPLRKARRWFALLVGGAVVQQVGWWSRYSELGLWCGLIGGAAVLAGALGFDCGVAGHSQDWKPMRFYFWLLLVFWALFGESATRFAQQCPALGTDEGWGERANRGCGAPYRGPLPPYVNSLFSLLCLLMVGGVVRSELQAISQFNQSIRNLNYYR